MKRDPEYAQILQRNNPSEYGHYLDRYNEWLASLPSSTNDYLKAKENGDESFSILDREFPVSQGEGSEEIEEIEETPVVETTSTDLAKEDAPTKEDKVQFLKENGVPLANINRSDEALDKNIAKVEAKLDEKSE